jgi:hypothetical protein
MLKRVRELIRCAIVASDGECGRVHDVYVDDRCWVVRDLAVDTGRWSASRSVLIPLASVERIEWPRRRVRVALTREQVRTSPGIDTHRPIEQRQEIAPYEYLGVPNWSGDRVDGAAGADDQHLYSARAVIGYAVRAVDGEVGYVEDFLVDDGPWAVRYLVVDSRHWWPGKRVLVAAERIRWVSWRELDVHVDLPRDPIRQAPGYDPARPVDPAYEARLREHYDRARLAA